MEETNIQIGGGRRLVLGFDAGCMTCSELARRIEERVGDRVEVRSLHHPQVEHWREQALGKDVPWTPTLFEVTSDEEVKAWTGAGMAVKLARVLGPLSTWRVMQALGEVSAPKSVTSGDDALPTPITGRAGVSRGDFLKGIGGATIAFGLLAGVGSPVHAKTTHEVAFSDLTEAFSAIEEIPDSVVRQGDKAVKQWLRRRLRLDEPQDRSFWGCVRAIGIALVSNALPVAKILKIKAAIKAVGGARNFVSILQVAYNYARRRGYSRWGAIKFAANRAAEVSGKDVVGALLGIFSLTYVKDECF